MNARTVVEYTAATSWKALTYYNLYRFLIAFLFVALYWIGQLPDPLGQYDALTFAIASHIYLFLSVSAQLFIRFRHPSFVYQVSGQVLLDIVLISAFIYSSAGLNSGFGMLMVIAIAGGSILIPGRIGFFFAAIATIAVLGHEVYFQLAMDRPTPNYIHAGFLGVTYFVTAFIGHALARKVELSEALAEKRAVDLENLGKLNEHIVQRLQSGIIVLDSRFNIRLFNESARNLLGITDDGNITRLEHSAPVLRNAIENWLQGTAGSTFIIKAAASGVDVQVSLSRLTLENEIEILVFLDDVSRLRQQAQLLKLASLGRLMASIAHEVRNPLGAISHAGQLLSESSALNEEERRLTTIINEQSVRVNSIIENVMRISRRERPALATTDLVQWLTRFIDELKSRYGMEESDIHYVPTAETISANMDPSQFYQVMWNICENGIRYSRKKPLLEIRCGVQADSQRPYVDIIDQGSGVAPDIIDQLFEPFITTETRGTGLGLFIARELCEANQATLNLYYNTPEGCCFRINFSHPERKQVIY
jgi:two-component system sensor histidine kinase PilS (NtrC family)